MKCIYCILRIRFYNHHQIRQHSGKICDPHSGGPYPITSHNDRRSDPVLQSLHRKILGSHFKVCNSFQIQHSQLSLNIFTEASFKMPNNIFADPSFKITPKHLSISTVPYPILLTLNNIRTDKTGNVHKTKQLGITGYLHLECFSDGHVI